MTPPMARAKRKAAALIRDLCQVPEPLSVTEWAAKYRQLPETSTSPGPYDPTVAPYARRPQDVMADPDVSMVVLCWAAQTTKSTTIENFVGYRIDRRPGPIIVVQPKIDAAESWAKERFVPMVRSTPKLRELVKLGRSSESTLRYKTFPGGFLFVPSAQSATELASRSSDTLALDEVDRYEIIPGEGNPVEIAMRRQGAADVALTIITSTPRDAESTIIWPYLEGGTFEKYFVPCPHCGHRQHLVWARLDLATASFACEGCGVLIDERFKPAMLAAGEWRATNPDGKYPSFHLNALYSPFARSGWRAAADAWRRAQGKPADLQVFVNTWLAELWEDKGDGISGDALTARLEAGHERGVVPIGAGAITIGVDVQKEYLEWWVWGWGAGLESWVVDTGTIAGDVELPPTDPRSPWFELERDVLPRAWPHKGGGEMHLAAGFVDSGYSASKIYTAVKPWGRRFGVYPSKGIAGSVLLGPPKRLKDHGVVLYAIGVDGAKNEFLRSQIQEKVAGPGYVHLPDWLQTAQLDALVSEVRKRRLQKGQVIYEWRKRTPDTPNEALDCRNYARAALERRGAKFIRSLASRATEHSQRPDAPAVTPPPPPPVDVTQEILQRKAKPVKRRGGWTGGWRNRY